MGWLDRITGRETLRAQVTALQDEVMRMRRRASVGSGVEMQLGRFTREDNTELKGSKRWDTFAEMMRDPHIFGGIRRNTLPLLSAEWRMAPATEDERDVEIADFVSANLLRRSSEMFGRQYWAQTSWNQRLFEILDMLESGFSMFHKSWRVEGDKVVIDQLKWLEPSSVDNYTGWNLSETGDLVSINRQYTTPGQRFITDEEVAAEDVALYVWELKGERFDGNPLLRALYGPWYRKDFFLRMALLYSQKVGSPVPWIQIPDDDADTQAAAEDLAKLMRGESPDKGYAVTPRGMDGREWEAKYVGVDHGEVDRMRGLIDGEVAAIAHGSASKSQLLGETNTGSRALAETQQASEMFWIQALAECVCELETHGAGNLPGLIEELVDRNYADVNEYPRLVCSKIDPDANLSKVPALAQAVGAGLLPRHRKVAMAVSDWFGLDLTDEELETWEQEKQERAEQIAQGMPPDDDEDEEREQPDEAQMAEDDVRKLLRPLMRPEEEAPRGGGFRRPTRFEARFADLAGISETFRLAEDVVTAELRQIHRAAIDEIMTRARAGKITRRNLDGQRRSKWKASPGHVDRLLGALEATSEDGQRHVREEIQRQTRDVRLAAPAAKLKLTAQVLRAVAVLTINEIWQRAMAEALGEYERIVREEIADDLIWERLLGFLLGLSERPLEQRSREAITVAYSEGRDVGLTAAQVDKVVNYVIRSEVLDQNTCQTCRNLDGFIVRIGTDQYKQLKPPARCEGGDRCRGAYFPVAESLLGQLREREAVLA